MSGSSKRRRRSAGESSTRSNELYELLNQQLYEDENEDEEERNYIAMLRKQFADFGILENQVHKHVQTDPDVSKVPLMWLLRARDSAEVLCTEITNYINFLYHSAPAEADLSEEEIVSNVEKDGRPGGSSEKRELRFNSPSADASLERRYIQQRMKSILRLALLLRNSIPVPQKDSDDEVSSTEACLAFCDVSEKADKAIQTEELDDGINTLKSEKEMVTTLTQTDTIDGFPPFKSSTAAVDKSDKSSKGMHTPNATKARTSAKAPPKPPRKSISSISTFSNAPIKLQTGAKSFCRFDKPGSALATKKTCLEKIPERKQKDTAVNVGQIPRSTTHRSHYISHERNRAPGKGAVNTESAEASSSKFTSSSNPLNRPQNIFRTNPATSGRSGINTKVAEASSSKLTTNGNPPKPGEKNCQVKPALRRKKIVGEKSDYRLPNKSSSQPVKKS